MFCILRNLVQICGMLRLRVASSNVSRCPIGQDAAVKLYETVYGNVSFHQSEMKCRLLGIRDSERQMEEDLSIKILLLNGLPHSLLKLQLRPLT